MGALEFAEWRAFDRIGGMDGPDRADRRIALLASLFANAYRNPDAHPEPYSPDEMMAWLNPAWETNEPRRTDGQIEAELMQWAKVHNAIVTKREARASRNAVNGPACRQVEA